MNYTDLSKEISYALRHNPQKYRLSLNDEGWADLSQLIGSLRTDKRFTDLLEMDILSMIEFSEKHRHEVLDGKIRAVYGHSINQKIEKKPSVPPRELYHGTAHKFMDSIFEMGLVPKERQYVHLSEDIETAISVGKRRDEQPVILKIDSARANADGILFYLADERIWLADYIPSSYLILA